MPTLDFTPEELSLLLERCPELSEKLAYVVPDMTRWEEVLELFEGNEDDALWHYALKSADELGDLNHRERGEMYLYGLCALDKYIAAEQLNGMGLDEYGEELECIKIHIEEKRKDEDNSPRDMDDNA